MVSVDEENQDKCILRVFKPYNIKRTYVNTVIIFDLVNLLFLSINADLETQPIPIRIEGFFRSCCQENKSMKSFYILMTTNKP